ncbi:hypothetical protein BDW60DRAFT_220793 [Aspergillus nidulans var. acristatus]
MPFSHSPATEFLKVSPCIGQPPSNPATSRLFQPIQVGNMKLNHRIVLPPLTRNHNDDDHTPLPMMLAKITPPGFFNECQTTAWKEVIDAVHAEGSYYFQQIWGMGRASYPEFMAQKGLSYRTSSAVPMEGVDAIPEEIPEEEVLDVIQDFVNTAKRVISAGGDVVEIHCAHGYLLDQFFSDVVNPTHRSMGWIDLNRARLVLEVVTAAADAIGAERVGLRLSPYAAFQGAGKGDIYCQYLYVVRKLKDMAVPLAYLSLVEAAGDPGTMLFGSKTVNQERTLDFILEAWNNWSPVIWKTLVAPGRHFLANPDLFFRIQNGIELNKYVRSTFYLAKSEEYLATKGKV